MLDMVSLWQYLAWTTTDHESLTDQPLTKWQIPPETADSYSSNHHSKTNTPSSHAKLPSAGLSHSPHDPQSQPRIQITSNSSLGVQQSGRH